MKFIATAIFILALTASTSASAPRKDVIKCGKDLACCMENLPSSTDCCQPGHVCPVK